MGAIGGLVSHSMAAPERQKSLQGLVSRVLDFLDKGSTSIGADPITTSDQNSKARN
jgi:hypothetical protein